MNKKFKIMGATIIMVVLCICGSAFAWLTDYEEEKEGVFTVGKVDITLLGVDEDQILTPNEDLKINPQIKLASGSEASYVFTDITIPKIESGSIVTAEGNDYELDDADGMLIADMVLNSDDWVEVETVKDDARMLKKLYAYKGVLEPGETTSPVFSSTKVPNLVYEDDEDASSELAAPVISTAPAEVDAYAIQAEGYPEKDASSLTTDDYIDMYYDALHQQEAILN